MSISPSSYKKILLTGADGFIGSHLAELLLKSGYSFRAFVYYNSFNSWGWLEELPEKIRQELDVFAGDVRDPHGTKVAMAGCDAVLHLAALIGIPYSYYSPDTYVDTNVKGTLNLLQAAKELGIKRFIHTSTSEVYGTARYVPITEDHPLNAQSPYAASKIAADQLAISFYRSFGTPVTVMRPFNTYGPRQSARAVIPAIITQVASGNTKINLGALHPTRDFSYVEDTCRAFLAALETPNDIQGEVIQCGSGFEISIEMTAKAIAKIMGADIEIVSDESRLRPPLSEVERLWADASKAKRLLRWEPLFANAEGFERGLKETIRWFVPAENLSKYKADRCNI
jgi:NAD dependent epimerase/dehydratase